jgi:hypothetical protein
LLRCHGINVIFLSPAQQTFCNLFAPVAPYAVRPPAGVQASVPLRDFAGQQDGGAGSSNRARDFTRRGRCGTAVKRSETSVKESETPK